MANVVLVTTAGATGVLLPPKLPFFFFLGKRVYFHMLFTSGENKSRLANLSKQMLAHLVADAITEAIRAPV